MGSKLVLITNRKSICITIGDLEWPWTAQWPFCVISPNRIHVQCRLKTIIRHASVSKSTFDSLWPHYLRSARLFSEYLGKTTGGNSRDFRL